MQTRNLVCQKLIARNYQCHKDNFDNQSYQIGFLNLRDLRLLLVTS